MPGDIFMIFCEVAVFLIYHLANKVGQKFPSMFLLHLQDQTVTSRIHMFTNSDLISKTRKFLFVNSKMFTVISHDFRMSGERQMTIRHILDDIRRI